MNLKIKRVSVVCALGLVSMGWGMAQGARTADKAAITAQLQGYAAARTLGEGHAQALFYTEDGDEWGSAAREPTKGRAALEKTLNATPDPKRRFNLEIIEIIFAGADSALVDALYSGASLEPAGHGAYFMVKRNGKWLIRSARITRFPAPSPAR
jgi:hypothetical protein